LCKFDKAETLFQRALSLNPESLQVQNNYANLLIDLSKFDQAYDILQSIISIEPTYTDAINNLNRLVALRKSVSDRDLSADFDFQDPLLFAFEKSEIDHSRRQYKMSKESLSNAQLQLSKLSNPKGRDVALEQLAAARHALDEKQIDLSLSCCSQAYCVLGPNPDIFDLASDIYLNLNKFELSESYLLHAVALDGLSLKRCFNLVSFAIMRNDLNLAKFYFEKATSIDPSAPDLLRLEEMLKKKSSESFSYSF
jgi:Tfp pilus assembly protein PilF